MIGGCNEYSLPNIDIYSVSKGTWSVNPNGEVILDTKAYLNSKGEINVLGGLDHFSDVWQVPLDGPWLRLAGNLPFTTGNYQLSVLIESV